MSKKTFSLWGFFYFLKKLISECLRATQWKFDYCPSEKPLLKIFTTRWFLLSWAFAFQEIRAKRVHSRFLSVLINCLLKMSCQWVLLGFRGLAPEQGHSVGIYHGSEKVPFVYPCLKIFCFWFFLIFNRYLLKIAPDVTKWSQESLRFIENRGQFSWWKWVFNVFKCF